MRVAVYTIALDEARFVERYLASAHEADFVVVADTGSSDGTPDLLRQGGATVHHLRVRPWRFDDARNASLALLPEEVDVCIALDLDETLSPDWRSVLENEWGDATRGRYLYTFNHHVDGSPNLTFWADKIHARSGYRWVHACHEHLVPDRTEERSVDLSLEIHQFADPEKSRRQYLPLLELTVAEHPTAPRPAYYLGREYTYVERWSDALRELERYISMPSSIWRPERAAACRLVARCHTELGRPEDAILALLAATEEAPELRESWVALAQWYHDRRQWRECLDAAHRALSIAERPLVYLSEGWAWGARADDLASVAAWWLGLEHEALSHARRAAAMEPHDERLHGNVEYIERHPRPGSTV